MPKKIKHTGKQVSMFFAHVVIFAIVNAILWYVCYSGATGWVYPWPAWITASWALCVIGHACTIWSNYEDRGMDIFNQQTQN